MLTDIDAVREATAMYRETGWPWIVTGVFGVDDYHSPYSEFCYTIGAGGNKYGCEFWMPCLSIEDRYMNNNMTGAILNYLAAGVIVGVLNPGDDVRVPLGIPTAPGGAWEHDADGYFWIGEPADDVDNRYATNMTPIDTILPIRWSSPLGWKDDA